MGRTINEYTLEETTLGWFLNLGYQPVFEPDISPEVKLSKLISGELRVPDAEKFVEGTV